MVCALMRVSKMYNFFLQFLLDIQTKIYYESLIWNFSNSRDKINLN